MTRVFKYDLEVSMCKAFSFYDSIFSATQRYVIR